MVEPNPPSAESSPADLPTAIPTGRPKGKAAKWALGVATLLVTGAAVWWLGHQNQGFSFARFASLLQEVRLLPFALAALAGFCAFLLRALRWQVLVGPYAGKASLVDLLGNTFIAFASVLVLGRPAELLRPYLISRQLKVSFTSQAGTWLLERIYDLLAVLTLAAWALSTISLDALAPGSVVALALRAGGAMVLVAALLALALLLVFTFAGKRAAQRLEAALEVLPPSRRQRTKRLVGTFVESVAVTRNPLVLARVLLLSTLHWLVVGFSSWLVFQSFPASEALLVVDAFRFLALLGLASAVPLPGLAGGYLLIAALLLTEWLGLQLEQASAVALGVWTVQLGITVPLGLAAALRSGLNWRKLKNMEREAQL
jgi:glycosyltransferase 2 family protein